MMTSNSDLLPVFWSTDRVSPPAKSNMLKAGGIAVKKSRYTEEQISFALQQAEHGTPVKEGIRKLGISEPSYYY